MALSFQVFNPRCHLASDFGCGEPALDEWLRTMASQHRRRHISSTFVYVDDAVPEKIIGYYALTVSELVKTELPALLKKMPRVVPVIRLGRLAIDVRFQGRGHGKEMLADALLRAGSQIAGVGLVVDALHVQAAEFYRGLGFYQLQSDPLKFFYPLATLR